MLKIISNVESLTSTFQRGLLVTISVLPGPAQSQDEDSPFAVLIGIAPALA
jgi:hypothetical protein